MKKLALLSDEELNAIESSKMIEPDEKLDESFAQLALVPLLLLIPQEAH